MRCGICSVYMCYCCCVVNALMHQILGYHSLSCSLCAKDVELALQRAKAPATPVLKYQQNTNSAGAQETHTVTFSNTVLSIYSTAYSDDADLGAAIMDAMNAALDRCGRDAIIEVQVFYPSNGKF